MFHRSQPSPAKRKDFLFSYLLNWRQKFKWDKNHNFLITQGILWRVLGEGRVAIVKTAHLFIIAINTIRGAWIYSLTLHYKPPMNLTMHRTSKKPRCFQVQSLTLPIIFDVSSISNFVTVSEYTYLKMQVIAAFSFQKWA